MAVISKDEFINLIKNKIDVQYYEHERISRLFNLLITEIVLGVFLYLGFLLILYLFSDREIPMASTWQVIVGIIYIVLIVAFFTLPDSFNKDFKTDLKSKCRRNLLKTLDLSTFNGKRYTEADLKESELFSTFNQLEYDDVIVGKYNDINFKIAEAELRDIRGSGKNKQDWQTFKGVIISFPSNKSINALTLVTTKGDSNIRNYITGMKFNIWLILSLMLIPAFFTVKIFYEMFLSSFLYGGFSSLIKMFSGFVLGSIPNLIILGIFGYIIAKRHIKQKKKMQDVKTEDISFDKRFCVYSKDQIEARYLVTPAFMERMKALETSFGTKKIKCSFYSDKIMFAMSTNKDLFELGSLWQPFGKDIEKFYDEIKSIHDMIDHFKLNEKTGL